MNLQRINPQYEGHPRTTHPRVVCIACSYMFFINDGYADLEGVPFKAYYCGECGPRQGSPLPDGERRYSICRL